MNLFEILKRSLRISSLALGSATLMVGLAAAVIRQTISPLPVLLCFLFVWTAQLASNCYGSLNERHNRYGSLALEDQQGMPKVKDSKEVYTMLRDVSYTMAVISLTIGVVLAGYTGVLAFMIGAVILILAYINIQGPAPLNRTPFGPLITYLLFGPLGIVGVSLLQTDDATLTFFDWFDLAPAVFLGCAFGLLAVNVHLAVNYTEYRQDLLAHRPSFTVSCGRKATRIFFLVNGFLVWVIFYGMITTTYFQQPWLDLLIPTFCTLFNCWIWYRMRKFDGVRSRWNPYSLSLLNAFIFGILILSVFSIIGQPEPDIRDSIEPTDVTEFLVID